MFQIGRRINEHTVYENKRGLSEMEIRRPHRSRSIKSSAESLFHCSAHPVLTYLRYAPYFHAQTRAAEPFSPKRTVTTSRSGSNVKRGRAQRFQGMYLNLAPTNPHPPTLSPYPTPAGSPRSEYVSADVFRGRTSMAVGISWGDSHMKRSGMLVVPLSSKKLELKIVGYI